MLRNRILTVALLAALALPANAGTKEQLIQLQTSMDNLQAQIQRMQQSFDERMGVVKNLIDQTTDNINRMNTNVDALSKTLAQQSQQNGQQNDQLSGQVQQMHDSVDELKARIAKVSKQLEDFQAQQQNLQAQPAGTAGANVGAPGSSSTGTAPPPGFGGTAGPGTGNLTNNAAPPPDVLYNNGLRDYNSGKLDLANQEFSDYLHFYPTTDLAGNAQFYVADILYRNGDYANAVKAYDRVLEQYPGGNKAASAQLKKGYSLLELGQKEAGIRELRALTVRYPRSIEAQQAKDRLRSVGAAPSAANTAPKRRVR